MKTKYQHATIVFGIIFSILPIVFYVAAIFAAIVSYFLTGFIIQIIGGALIAIAKREHAKTKEQDRQDLERLTAANKQFDEDKKLT